MEAASRSYHAVPPEAADVLRPVLPGLADETIEAIAREVPDYARAMEGEFGQVVRLGVEVAFNRFVDLLAAPEPDAGSSRQTYVNLGRGEFHAGRSLDALLAAYRVGARHAWRRFVTAGVEGGLSPGALYALGEAIFAYIDELSAESAEGFAEEQSVAAGESERRRRRLVRLLVQDPPAGQEAIRSAAAAAGWTLPRRLAALVPATGGAAADPPPASSPSPAASSLASSPAGSSPASSPGASSSASSPAGSSPASFPTASSPAAPPASSSPAPSPGEPATGEAVLDSIAARVARRLGEGAIGAEAGGDAVVLLPDPDAPGRRRRLEAAIGERSAGLGHTVAWAGAAASARRAAATHRLAAAGRLPAQGLLAADDHLPALLLAADPVLAQDLARTRLAPLAELPDAPRERLTETLRAWLDRPGQVQAVAAALDVHPQTVRYRIRQLRDLFGERLDDPEARFELALALRAR